MFRRRDGRLLRTKVVATLGDLRREMYGPTGAGTSFEGGDGDWDTFLNWFAADGTYIVDVFRINLSFFEPREDGTPDPDCKELKILGWLASNREAARDVAVLADLPGPKLRLLGVGEGVELSAGQRVELRLTGDLAGPTICAYGRPVAEQDEGFSRKLEGYRKGSERPLVSIGDGLATLGIVEVTPEAAVCEALDDGLLAERKGVTFKGLSLDLMTFQEDDERAVDFMLDHAVDWNEHPWRRDSAGSFLAFVAVSFVRCAEDIERAKRYIEDRVVERLRPALGNLSEVELRAEARNFAPGVIAKIETRDATEDIERILDIADGAMVARGDLALQIGPQNVPSFQKKIIRLCNLRGKPVITATQMLSTMVSEPEPTRAEASDVFNAILDGTDAVMLSDETASGRYPYLAVRTMIEIAEAAEAHLEGPGRAEALEQLERRRLAERELHDMVLDSEDEIERTIGRLTSALERARAAGDGWLEDVYREKLERGRAQKITDEISAAACAFASSGPDYRAIVAPTTSGRTVRMISRFRPNVPVLACAHDVLNHKKLVMSFGVYALNCGRLGDAGDDLLCDSESVYEKATGILTSRGILAEGDLIVWTAGSSLFVPGTTDLIKIRRIE